MPRYVSLLRFTEKGFHDFADVANRAHAFDRAAEKVGVTVEGQYGIMGGYDGAVVINAENEFNALQLLDELTAEGSVRSDATLGLGDEDFDKLGE